MTFYDPERTLISDTECYPNFWSIGFRRVSDGKTLVMEHSARRPMTVAQRERIRNLLLNNTLVGYNWQGYDIIMICKLLEGASNAELKQTNDKIIVGRMKYWNAEEVLGITVPRSFKFMDLMEVSPAPPTKTGGEQRKPSLKTLAGRMHAPKMQDLPYSPDTNLTEQQMDEVLSYMGNDLDVTHMLFDALREPLELRHAASEKYGMDFMSKSDSQMGEAIIKKRVEQMTGQRAKRVETPAGTSFRYKVPEWATFNHPTVAKIVERLHITDFYVGETGKIDLPEWLESAPIKIGDTIYQMGIGGLHSTEKNRCVHGDDEAVLIDADVESQYPNIILSLGLYPKSIGPHFIEVYGGIKKDRVAAKVAKNKNEDQSLKIALNGGGFGKLGSKYSVLYAPHLLLAVTLTGQLSLLRLIERAHDAGIPVVSGNTDGVVFHCPRHLEDRLMEITAEWQEVTSFKLEYARYRSIYNSSVNSYIAVKEDGTTKIKGPLGNPWRAGDTRGQLMKNPQATIVSDAVIALITEGTPVEETIRAGTDVRDYLTVIKVDGGATWRGEHLGKVVRFYWAHGGEEIYRAKGHWKTGNHGKVPKSDGCRPLMELPDEFPDDIDYDAYITAAREALMDIGYDDRPPPIKKLRLFKYNAIAWFALAV